jgi:hypothetical protein
MQCNAIHQDDVSINDLCALTYMLQIGVDIVSVSTIPRGVASVAEYLNMFKEYFSEDEMEAIHRLLCALCADYFNISPMLK